MDFVGDFLRLAAAFLKSSFRLLNPRAVGEIKNLPRFPFLRRAESSEAHVVFSLASAPERSTRIALRRVLVVAILSLAVAFL